MHRKSPPDRWWSRRAAAVVVVHIRHQGGRFVGGSLSGGYPKEMENTAQIAIAWLCRLPRSLETVIKEAIARGGRRQVRVLVLPLRREVLRLRRASGDALV
jgi:hypothetical protein